MMLKPGQVIKEFKTNKGCNVVLLFISKGDAAGIQKMTNSIISENDFIPRNKKITLKEEEQWVKEMVENLKKKHQAAICAVTKSKIIGRSVLMPFMGKQSHSGEIWIIIMKDYREQGIGTALLNETLKLAKKEFKLKLIELSVFKSNKLAIGLYRKFNFKKYGILPKAYCIKNKYIDKVLLLKELK